MDQYHSVHQTWQFVNFKRETPSSTNNEQLHVQIRKERLEKHISLHALAEKCFMDADMMASIERGEIVPDAQTFEKIVHVLKLSCKEK